MKNRLMSKYCHDYKNLWAKLRLLQEKSAKSKSTGLGSLQVEMDKIDRSNSKGVAILLNNQCSHEVIALKKDQEDGPIFLELKLSDHKFTLSLEKHFSTRKC
uniref:Uncharacterized protein n=1 Tax=Romanomermis culicivorax TaxID=13658 RepID=A0A915IKN8_ROMCU